MEAVPNVVLVVELLVSRYRPQCGALCVECPGGSPVRRQSPNVVLIVCELPVRGPSRAVLLWRESLKEVLIIASLRRDLVKVL